MSFDFSCLIYSPADFHLLKVNNASTKTWCEIWCLYCSLWTYFTPCSSVSIVNFKDVTAGWSGELPKLIKNLHSVILTPVSQHCPLLEYLECIYPNEHKLVGYACICAHWIEIPTRISSMTDITSRTQNFVKYLLIFALCYCTLQRW